MPVLVLVAEIKLPTNLILIVAGVLAVGAVIAIAKTQTGRRAAGGDVPAMSAAGEDGVATPYILCALFSPAELSFLRVLEQAIDGRYRVFAKVRLGDVLGAAQGLSNSERAKASNRVQSKHLDFVLCDPATLAVVAAIELDDSSHKRTDRVERDDFLDRACDAAGLRLIRVPARAGYSVNELRSLIQPLAQAST